ncbi:tyrosine-type recombinase/integrase [Streptomyces sp. NPDC020807]|uniref:tyrosine-type recombinase/integrase n=1 Tax=Streptomyces sp. NPDC020807 TaxID=3155119 RepID=UPI0033D9F5F5
MADTQTFTARNRRIEHHDEGFVQSPITRFANAELKAAPAPIPSIPPGPFGDLSRAPVSEIVRIIDRETKGQPNAARRRRSVELIFASLEQMAGTTWQEKWTNSSFDREGAEPVRLLAREGNRNESADLTAGLKMAFILRIIRPSLSGFRANRIVNYADRFREFQADPYLDEFFSAVDRRDFSHNHRYRAKFDVAVALTTQGIALKDLTPPALLHYAMEAKRLGLTYGNKLKNTRFAAHGAWQVLHQMGHFPPGTPPTLRTYVYRGQLTIEQLVDRYPIEHQGVRKLLIEYLTRRRASTDYTTISALSRHLVFTFWAKIEKINPGQQDLVLSPQVYDQWREAIKVWDRDQNRKRIDDSPILLAVRALYLDLHSWAINEPERWAQWVAPCPISTRDLKGFAKRKREINQRMANRVRARQPLLPLLVAHVEGRHDHLSALLQSAQAVQLGEAFVHKGHHYRRTNSSQDQIWAKNGEEPPVRVIDEDGVIHNITSTEETAFWEWAGLEILRHSGIRIEELCELTHLSIRQYQRPNGEVIALLVIAPSKSERERVIPMSADLFHAIAQVIRRLTPAGRPVRLLNRYDHHEKTWSEPMPYLMQRQAGTQRMVIASTTFLHMFARSCKELAETNRVFADTTFTPHDFRRLFATELVNGGLPVHIGAALLGHLDLRTLQGYVAVFAEDVVANYQRFLTHRRSLRPDIEYTEVTPEEWADFEEHFDKRKVELGNCARPYGTPCNHEHACIRCPMLQVNPKMLSRLSEIEKDLLLRRKRAQEEHWLGEIEGIDSTLVFLRSKKAEVARLTKRTTTDLGIPRPRPREI